MWCAMKYTGNAEQNRNISFPCTQSSLESSRGENYEIR